MCLKYQTLTIMSAELLPLEIDLHPLNLPSQINLMSYLMPYTVCQTVLLRKTQLERLNLVEEN